MTDITLSDSLLVLSTLTSPFLAVYVQKWIENWRQEKDRRIWLFRTLMATRQARVSDRHVEALNMIDIEYHQYKHKKGQGKRVLDAWKNYYDSLEAGSNNYIRRNDLFIKLLHEMAQFLGYDYNEAELRRDSYSPQAHLDREKIQTEISTGLHDIFTGQKTFPISVIQSDSLREIQEEKRAEDA